VEAGAVRFSTGPLSKLHSRDLVLDIGRVTVRVRGTDVWGRASSERDLVVLIDGRISVGDGGGGDVAMDEPLTLYAAPPPRGAGPVLPADPRVLHRWVQETNLESGGGIVRPAGDWRVNLMSFARRGDASTALRRLHEAGYAAEVQEAPVAGSVRYRVVMDGFSAISEAEAFSRAMDGRFGIRGAWVSQVPIP